MQPRSPLFWDFKWVLCVLGSPSTSDSSNSTRFRFLLCCAFSFPDTASTSSNATTVSSDASRAIPFRNFLFPDSLSLRAPRTAFIPLFSLCEIAFCACSFTAILLNLRTWVLTAVGIDAAAILAFNDAFLERRVCGSGGELIGSSGDVDPGWDGGGGVLRLFNHDRHNPINRSTPPKRRS